MVLNIMQTILTTQITTKFQSQYIEPCPWIDWMAITSIEGATTPIHLCPSSDHIYPKNVTKFVHPCLNSDHPCPKNVTKFVYSCPNNDHLYLKNVTKFIHPYPNSDHPSLRNAIQFHSSQQMTMLVQVTLWKGVNQISIVFGKVSTKFPLLSR